MSPAQVCSLLGILNLHGILVLIDLRNDLFSWRDVASFQRSTRSSHHGDDAGLVWLLERVSNLASSSVDVELQESNGWTWKVGSKQVTSWKLPNQVWRGLLAEPRVDFIKLNYRWREEALVATWDQILEESVGFSIFL